MAKIGVVVADYRKEMAEKMLSFAEKKAAELGIEIAPVVRVPGAFDMPLAVKKMLEKKEIAAVICLAVVLQGGTGHDKIVAENAARKMSDLALQYNKPVLSGMIGPRVSEEQARERLQQYSEHAVESAARMLSLEI